MGIPGIDENRSDECNDLSFENKPVMVMKKIKSFELFSGIISHFW